MDFNIRSFSHHILLTGPVLFHCHCALAGASDSGAASPLPTTIEFAEQQYLLEDSQELATTITIDPVPEGGLYSAGMKVTVRSIAGNLVGFLSPSLHADLGFDGVRLRTESRSELLQGAAALKGSADFTSPAKATLNQTELAAFRLSGLTPGSYTLGLTFWNELGATEDIFVTGCCVRLDPFITFETAQLEVVQSNPVENLAIQEIQGLTFNPQTGLFEQVIRITNTGNHTVEQFRLWIESLPDGVALKNAHGSENDDAFLELRQALAAGESVELTLEYHDPTRRPSFTPIFRPEQSEAIAPLPSPDRLLNVDLRIIEINARSVLVEFITQKNFRYQLEYSDNMTAWSVAQPEIIGTGERIQWLDNGLPKTSSLPSSKRFYRITTQP